MLRAADLNPGNEMMIGATYGKKPVRTSFDAIKG